MARDYCSYGLRGVGNYLEEQIELFYHLHNKTNLLIYTQLN